MGFLSDIWNEGLTSMAMRHNIWEKRRQRKAIERVKVEDNLISEKEIPERPMATWEDFQEANKRGIDIDTYLQGKAVLDYFKKEVDKRKHREISRLEKVLIVLFGIALGVGIIVYLIWSFGRFTYEGF